MPKIPTRTDDAGFFSFRRLLDPSRRRRRQRRQMIKVRPEESDAATGDRQRARDSECHAAGNARKGLRVQSASKRKGEVRGLFVNQRISQDCCMTRGGGSGGGRLLRRRRVGRGPGSGRKLKLGVDRRNTATSHGFSHRSSTARRVGCEGQLNR